MSILSQHLTNVEKNLKRCDICPKQGDCAMEKQYVQLAEYLHAEEKSKSKEEIVE